MEIVPITQKMKKVIESEKKRKVGFAGEVIKMMRLKNDYTQEALAKGICSVSHVSKIENNQVSSNIYILREVSKVFNTDVKNLVYLNDSSLILSKFAKALYYEDSALLNEIYEHISTVGENPLLTLHSAIKQILEGKNDSLDEDLVNLQKLIKSTPSDYTKLVGLVAVMHHFNAHEYCEAFNVLKTLSELPTEITEMKTLEEIYKYICSEKIGCHSVSAHHYIRATQLLFEHPQTKYMMLLPLVHAYYTTLNQDEVGRNIIEKMHLNQYERKYHNLFICTFVKAHTKKSDADINQEMINKLDDNHTNTEYYQALITYDQYCKKHQIACNQPKLNIKEIPDHCLGAMHFKVENITNEDEIATYVKEIALPYARNNQDIYYINYFTAILVDYANKKSRYKEAMMIDKKSKKIIKKIRRVI